MVLAVLLVGLVVLVESLLLSDELLVGFVVLAELISSDELLDGLVVIIRPFFHTFN